MVQLLVSANADTQFFFSFLFVTLFLVMAMFLLHRVISQDVFLFTRKRMIITSVVFVIQTTLLLYSYRAVDGLLVLSTVFVACSSFLYVSVFATIVDVIKNRLFKSDKSIAILLSLLVLNPYSLLLVQFLFLSIIMLLYPPGL